MEMESERLTDEEQAYFTVLVEKNFPKLYRITYQHLKNISIDSIEDVIQETLYRACKKIKQIMTYDSPEAWLTIACRNVAMEEVKRCLKLEELTFDPIVYNDTSDGLDHILPSGLRPEDRKLLIWHYVYGYTFEEIAQLIGKKPAAVRQQMARLKKQLSKKLREAPPV